MRALQKGEAIKSLSSSGTDVAEATHGMGEDSRVLFRSFRAKRRHNIPKVFEPIFELQVLD
jgi:hypothetical protein